MFARHRGLRLGSPPVASWIVDKPGAERATLAMSWKSSSKYS
jgi:hypothetical protein